MKRSFKHLLLGGGIFLGAAACGFLIWWSATPLPHDGAAVDGASAPPPAQADSHDAAAHAALHSTPPPPPDLDELMRLATAGTGGAETAARMEAAMAEAARRFAQDPKAALAWALQQGDLTRHALGAVLDAWAATDPAEAFEALRWTKEEEATKHRNYGLSHLIAEWSATDPASAWKAVGTLPDSIESASLKGRVADIWAAKDPAAAAAALKAITSGGRGKEEQQFLQSAFSTVAHRLAAQDATKAAEWALSFADGTPEQACAVAGVVSGWYAKDPKAASAWLDARGEGVVFDTGAAALVTLCTDSAPEVALQWAQAISNEAQRSSLTLHAATRWFVADPNKAEAWLRDSKLLSAEQRDVIRTSLGNVSALSGVTRSK